MKLVKHQEELTGIEKVNQGQLERFMAQYHKYMKENIDETENIPSRNSIDDTYGWINDTIELLDQNGWDTSMDLFHTDTGIYHNSVSSYIDVMVYLYYLLNHLKDESIHVEFNENDMGFEISSGLYAAGGGSCSDSSTDPLVGYQHVIIYKH